LTSAAMHGSVSVLDVGEGSGDGSPVVAGDVGVVPSGVSQGADDFFQGSVASEGVAYSMAVEAVGSVFYLSTRSDACMSDVVAQVIHVPMHTCKHMHKVHAHVQAHAHAHARSARTHTQTDTEPWAVVCCVSSLDDGTSVSSNHPRAALVPRLLYFTLPPRHLGSLTAAISLSFDLIVSCSSC